MQDKFTGKSRGFAFLEMSTAEEANKAIEMWNGKDCDGRALTVNIARPREEGGAPRAGGGYRGGGGGGGGRQGGGGGYRGTRPGTLLIPLMTQDIQGRQTCCARLVSVPCCL